MFKIENDNTKGDEIQGETQVTSDPVELDGGNEETASPGTNEQNQGK
jgi:hypothetical protein